MKNPKDRLSAGVEPDLIDRLYDVAVDPLRFETLLDHWEEMIGPQRAATELTAKPDIGLQGYESHFMRAEQVLDRVIADHGDDSPQAMVNKIDRSAAFVIDRNLQILAANGAAITSLGIAQGAIVDQVNLGPGEAEELGRLAAGMFHGNKGGPILMRAKSGRVGHVIVIQLRLLKPEHQPPHIVATTAELGWPDGFSQTLGQAFALTDAELDIIRGLAQGGSLTDIAENRGRSLETVRAQLKSVMSKTETRTQSELVRLTLSMMELTNLDGMIPSGLTSAAQGYPSLMPRPYHTLILPDKSRLDYLILGDPTGRPLFFLPMVFGMVRWQASAEAEAIRRGIKIIVPIRPGYGHSTPIAKGAPYIARLVQVFAALLDHLKAPPLPFLTFGSDSLFAIAFHAVHPEKITAVVACAGVLPFNRPAQFERMEKWHRLIHAGARYTPHLLPFLVKATFALAKRIGKRALIRAVFRESKSDLVSLDIPEVLESILCGTEVTLSDTHSAHDAFAREIIACETTDWSRDLARIEGAIPVHFLCGLQDPQVPPQTLAEFQSDHDWIDFRLYPDTGQAVFNTKWRDALDLLEIYLPEKNNRSE